MAAQSHTLFETALDYCIRANDDYGQEADYLEGMTTKSDGREHNKYERLSINVEGRKCVCHLAADDDLSFGFEPGVSLQLAGLARYAIVQATGDAGCAQHLGGCQTLWKANKLHWRVARRGQDSPSYRCTAFCLVTRCRSS